ncbi:MAG: hypothetical protein AMJ53_10625, partial [Gammaproteobacteria bacterium SG8_11]
MTARANRTNFALWASALLAFSSIVIAAPPIPITTGISAGVGTELDETNNHLYYVQYNAPELKRIVLTPECENDTAVSCAEQVISTGFTHAEDVALDIDHGLAYVTTRDNPGTGGLWKVDIATGTKTLVTFNLWAPQQLVLDLTGNQGYVVGYDDGRLRRVDLITGAKTPIFTALQHPVGLAVTNDLATAYVTEQQAPARVSKIDLTLGIKIGDVVTNGIDGVSLVAPFFLEWTDSSQNSLFVAEREPANRVSRLDLVGTPDLYDVTVGLTMPFRPTGLAAKGVGTPLFVTAESEIVKLEFLELSGPIFMAVGHVPSSSISTDGYADTVSTLPGYFYRVRHSPFGGTMNIFGNFTQFLALGAKYYAIKMTKGGVDSHLSQTWRVSRWDTTEMKYKAVTIAPAVNGYMYEIPVEASDNQYHPELWWYPFWMMRWPSGEDGTVTLSMEIYDSSVNNITSSLSALAAPNSLTLHIDNTPHTVKINKIMQVSTPHDIEIKPCDITSGTNQYYFEITAYDANQHLRNYWLEALWGDNKHETIVGYSDNYENHIDPVAPHPWSGVINFVPTDSMGDKITWAAKCDCAHTFYLRAKKRTINGYHYTL